MATSIAVFGTGSSVGKSLISAALCRIFSNTGYDVVPFKSQNMSNNSGVTFEGLEMGRAQIIQAIAARKIPSAHMNPVLIKPTSFTQSQVVVQGKVYKKTDAYEYFNSTLDLWDKVCESYHKVSSHCDICVIEGAGSCCELNLRERDLVNFRTAFMAQSKVIIVGDIDKGGIFAQLIGTYELLSVEEKAVVAGFIVNKFRGDIRLFEDGVKIIEEKTGKKVLGVIPYSYDLRIEEEDGLSSESSVDNIDIFRDDKINVAVVRLPRISNLTDINPLELDERFCVTYVFKKTEIIEKADIVIIPGSKNTIEDAIWMDKNGFSDIFKKNKGKRLILGICGGFQIMGKTINDPDGLESSCKIAEGLDFFDMHTEISEEKILSSFSCELEKTGKITGYEIHMGKSRFVQDRTFDILVKDGIRIVLVYYKANMQIGTYLHGIFDSTDFRDFITAEISWKKIIYNRKNIYSMDNEINKLASHVKKFIDIDFLLKEMGF
jgi:adenosylcobyric acid synthase